MRPVALDLSSQASATVRRWRRIAMLLLGAGLVAAGAGVQRYGELRGELDAWRADLRRIDRHRAGAASRPVAEDALRLRSELQRANRVIEALSTPWADLFAAAEAGHGEDAVLMGIEPDPARREVRLTAEAKNLPAMIDYLKSLRESPVLMDAALATHQVNVKDPQRPVRFVIAAHWFDKPAETAQTPQASETPAPAGEAPR